MGRLWCFLCLQIKKEKKTKLKLLTCRVEKELYGLQFTNESQGDSMWKNFGLPCGKKAYRVGKKKENRFKLGSKKKFSHAWAIEHD